MPTYRYLAATAAGEQVSGRCRGRTTTEARFALHENGLSVLEIESARGLADLDVTPARIKPTQLMHLSKQLSAFIDAGIPLMEAMRELAENSDSRAVRRVIDQISEDLRAGSTLSEAFERHSRDFPPFYLGILRSAELTGDLAGVLDQLSTYLERDLEARRKVRSALIYPALVAVFAAGTAAVLTLVVLPKFEAFFDGLGAELPLATRLLMASSDFLRHWGLALLAAVGVVLVGRAILVRTPRGRLLNDRIVLRMPLVGHTIRTSLVERFTRVLGLLVAGGIPLPEALRVATVSLDNAAFAVPLEQARNRVIEGAGLSGPIAGTRMFPGMAVQMMHVGETTGTLEEQLGNAARFYSRELDHQVKRMATLLEPTVVLVMGGLVGFVAVALVSAMYGIFRVSSLS